MTAGCARCGNCCDPVVLDDETYERLGKYWTSTALESCPDPRTGEGWAAWLEIGHTDDDRERQIAKYIPGSDYRADADFITAHWHPLGDSEYRCDAFDPVTRLCTARDGRPPVCRNYPWYGREPSAEQAAKNMGPQCSYLADLPPDQRPEGSRPLIPLTPA